MSFTVKDLQNFNQKMSFTVKDKECENDCVHRNLKLEKILSDIYENKLKPPIGQYFK